MEWDGAHAAVANLPPFVETTLQWLRAYFSGLLPLPPLPDLDLRGTPFQLAVWRELLDVPFSTTLSYGALALRVGHRWPRPSVGVRAVAGAVGRNPVSILVPCHRIVGARGALGGYAGGVGRKVAPRRAGARILLRRLCTKKLVFALRPGARIQKIPSRSFDREGICFPLEGVATFTPPLPCDGIKRRLAPSWLWPLS